jgi:hypothetical protein
VIFYCESWNEVKAYAEQGLQHIDEWLGSNILTLNILKTNYICFSIYNDSQPCKNFNLKIHQCDATMNRRNCICPCLQRVAQTKYLGILLDQRLSWYPHLEFVSGRIRKLTWIFKTLRHVTPRIVAGPRNPDRDLLKEIYVALIQSVLVYCITTWGGAAKPHFIKVERAQRGLIKVMMFKQRRYHTELLYRESALLTVRQLYITQIVLKKYKHFPYDPNTMNRRRKDQVAKLPSHNTQFAKAQFNFRAVFLFNLLNKELDVYKKPYYNCRKDIRKWLLTKNFNETEKLLKTLS